MASINWNDGQLITLTQGDTATCTGNLNPGQLYGLFFYNAAGHDATTTVTITGNNALPPVSVKVPGTTANQGLAAICFVNGSDTTTIAASIVGLQPGAKLQAFICSVKMPTDTKGIYNKALPMNGHPEAFKKFTRYYSVPESHWYAATLTSNVNTFVCVQFQEARALVLGVNCPADGINNIIDYYGPMARPGVTIQTTTHQTESWNLQGNGRQWVWMNADSIQDSESATISLQSLQGLFE